MINPEELNDEALESVSGGTDTENSGPPHREVLLSLDQEPEMAAGSGLLIL